MSLLSTLIKRILFSILFIPSTALSNSHSSAQPSITLNKQPTTLRISYDYLNMPNNIEKMGLLGVNYFANINSWLYSGVGMYGSTVGTKGGLFVFTVDGGLRHRLFYNIWGDTGLDIGGGGGGASLVGGGLMIRPHVGLQYDFGLAQLGVYYSYITFPTGEIHSSQIGANIDLPFDVYYTTHQNTYHTFKLEDIHITANKFLALQFLDFGLLFQAYQQHEGTLNTNNQIQDGTIGLLGAEFDHYFLHSLFWWVKGSGAFTGISNGYMDILTGLGYKLALGTDSGFSILPQIGAGAGGGGKVDTGGGILIQPQLSLEIPLWKNFALRTGGGYIWAPEGQLGAWTITGMLLYHFNAVVGSTTDTPLQHNIFTTQAWRLHIFNQTYTAPQRASNETTSAITLLALQIDQLFNHYFFLAYQGAFAYAGFQSGGYASGMIGPGLQTTSFLHDRVACFTELLFGAGGGGGLQLSGGALIEPIVGFHINFTKMLGLQTSVGELKALSDHLSTPVVNVGFTLQFDTVNVSAP